MVTSELTNTGSTRNVKIVVCIRNIAIAVGVVRILVVAVTDQNFGVELNSMVAVTDESLVCCATQWWQ